MQTTRMNPVFTSASASSTGHRYAWITAFVLFMVGAMASASALAGTLDEIGYNLLPGDRVQLSLKLSGPAPEPNSFTIDNPARLALDLPDTGLALEQRLQEIGVGMTRSVRAVEANGRTRVVINLVRMVPYDLEVKDNRILVTIAGTPSGAVKTAAAQVNRVDGDAGYRITDIDFRRGAGGEGTVLVALSDPSISYDLREQSGSIVLQFADTQLPENLQRRLNVTDFATPVTTIDAVSTGSAARLTIAPAGEYEHLAYQTGKTLMVEIKPISKAEKAIAQRDIFGYTGERLSLNFQNIEVRAVLQLLADFNGKNLVASDTVGGNITLRLKNVPWDQALDIILRARGLGIREVGNVMMIAPAEELAARERADLQAQQQIESLAPLRSESIQVNYAKASDFANLIRSGDNSLLSERGQVTLDDRTNKLLIRDTAENLERIRALIGELDIPVRQVLIESRIVLASDDFNKELGVNFGVNAVRSANSLNNPTVAFTSGSLDGTTQAIRGDDIEAPGRYNVNLPVANLAGQAGSLALAFLSPNTLVELELSAAQAEGRTEIVSAPRVITANQKEAVIEQGVEIPYQEASSSGATSVSFKKAVLSLQVTPQITPDDRVIMDLKVNKDSVGAIVGGVPSINTQEVQTQVLVENGQTVVLGGVFERTKIDQIDRIPFFGELPVVGRLFRRDLNQDEKSELLVFVTPKILDDAMSAR